jgi:hypothetical protein
MASRISWTRILQSLGDICRLPQNALTHFLPDRVRRCEVHRSPKQARQVTLCPHELKKADGNGELHKDVHVAARPFFTSGEGTEHGQTRDTETPYLRHVLV